MMMLPKRKSGRQSAKAKEQYEADYNGFIADIISLQNSVDFKISSRGWGYYLEGEKLINKSEFNIVEKLINDARKNGSLPIDFTAKDTSRNAIGIVGEDYGIDNELKWQRKKVVNFIKNYYTPELLCDTTKVYIEVVVEKKDLVGLFGPVCKKYQIPIGNMKGWSDINSRADLLERCHQKYEQGCEVHILYCGDFDPAGLNISKVFKKNLKDLEEGTNISSDFIEYQIKFQRFGLNYDYIQEEELVWVENLMTGSGKDLNDPVHKDHNKPYVQDYIDMYGVRKVEANALLKDIPKARELMLNTINTLISGDDLESYKEMMNKQREELLEIFIEQWRVA